MRALVAIALAAGCGSVVDLPDGPPGIGFDDLRYSARLHRVLVPGGRSGRLDMIDPDTHDVTSITGFSAKPDFSGGYHDDGITSVDDLGGLLVVTDRTSFKISLVDVDAKAVVADAALGAGPDYVRWVAATSEVWVSEPDREKIEVFKVTVSPPSLVSVATIAVPGGPESLTVDQTHGRAYTHLWNGGTVGIDVMTRTVGERWTNGCTDSRGIAVDTERGFVFAGCAEGRVTVLDSTDGRVISEQWDVDGVDVIDYSPSRHHLYASGQISADTAIFGVSTKGELGLLGLGDGALYGHCVTTDDNGHAFVCDPLDGRIVVVDDNFGTVRQ